jgi:hypothetical protein
MKKTILNILPFMFSIVLCFSSCDKEDSGICNCHYYSGDEKNYDLSALSKSQQIDSCNHLDQLAGGFGGECDLE